MSQENVEIVLKNVEAFNRGDVDAFVATVSPDIEWEDAVFWSETPRTYRGKDELREWFHRVLEPWESFHVEADEIREAEDWVLVGGAITARGKGSGAETQLRGCLVFWVRDGMITKRQPFLDHEAALEAAGLSE